MKKIEELVASSACQNYWEYNEIKGNSVRKRRVKAPRREIKREQCRSYLAHVEQR